MINEGFTFTEEEIKEAKKLTQIEDGTIGSQYFDSQNRWVGYLGQLACADFWSSLKPIGGAGNDLESENGLIYEVKTRNGNFEIKDFYEFNCNKEQYDKHPEKDFYIMCYFNLKTQTLKIVGWIKKDQVPRVGIYHQKGTLLDNGKTCSADMWSVPFDSLNKDLVELPLDF